MENPDIELLPPSQPRVDLSSLHRIRTTRSGQGSNEEGQNDYNPLEQPGGE